MSFFVVKYCTLKACLNWRIGGKCTKDGKDIPKQMKYVVNIHDSSVCEIRRQLDKYRLENLLEK